MGVNVLFYRRDDGAGKVGTFHANAFKVTQPFPPDSFARGWTLVSADAAVFYNEITGSAATGVLREGAFHTVHTYGGKKKWGLGWTNTVDIDYLGRLFYSRLTGVGVVGFDPSVAISEGFAKGWSHIVAARDGLEPPVLFYNRITGAAALAVAYYEEVPGSGEFKLPNAIRTVREYPPGQGDASFLPGWTHVVSPDEDAVLFYNSANGAGALGRLTKGGFVEAVPYAKGSFSKGWTHIVGRGAFVLFYNAVTGAIAVGQISHTGSSPQFATVPTNPASEPVGTGWTDVAITEDPPIIK